MNWLADLRIRAKLTLVTVLTSAISLLLASAIIIVYDNYAYHAQKTGEISAQAGVIAASVNATLEFNDPKAAQEYLNPLEANPAISAAGVYVRDGSLFAAYSRSGARPPPASIESQTQPLEDSELAVFWPVQQGQRRIGTVYLRARIEPLAVRITRFGGIILLVMVGSLLITLPIAMRLNSVIADPVRDIAEAASRIAGGDLSARVEAVQRADEIGVLINTFAHMIVNLRNMTQEISEVAQVLAGTTGEILASTAQVSANATGTAAAVKETTITVEEVKQTAQVASQKAKYVSDSAQKASQVSKTGRKSVDDTIQGMHRIQEQMQYIAESIVQLSEQSQAIGEITATVNGLAEQSNLLAVNAAIEAAKAGEQGKGFGVVAQEIKSLAEQSKQATAQVRAILGDIQKATSASVLAAEQGNKAVESGMKQSTETGEAIRLLADSISEAAQAATQIAASSQQQMVGMDQVALAMENIKQASFQNVSGTKQAEVAAQRLHELGQKLKQLAAQYKVLC
ncbi:Methyl-accepting chemotaxis sensory transducer [Candidatus Methylobacter favarea]|uniref:Methyl-accepting chemotaxis sensory transducer n=1 Tax=Candidatus Methylobacter favarea TaxID=2707345 RepID=A0A8S0WIX3_9GAMM|nr:methyl-accepting chemotaxis protein [Candidatus Methylobacter favarea]CAA9890864.1 Methyl-accepting chemotaxis sensory transducer [Candidatus Methylobacter favarea]